MYKSVKGWAVLLMLFVSVSAFAQSNLQLKIEKINEYEEPIYLSLESDVIMERENRSSVGFYSNASDLANATNIAWFVIDDIKEISFYDASTAIESLPEAKLHVRMRTDGINVSGIKTGEKVSVISVDGIEMMGIGADENGNAEVSTVGIPSGTYIVKIANYQTIKINKL